jgi:hypothetical protein
MKNILQFILLIVVSLNLCAQSTPPNTLANGVRIAEISAQLKNYSVKKSFKPEQKFFEPPARQLPRVNAPLRQSSSTVQENIIGCTYYDLQSNCAMSNRVTNNNDGTFSAVWTTSPNSNAGYPLRGTGYNYFDGNSWLNFTCNRIESVRTGFTSISVTPSGHEMAVSHKIMGVDSSVINICWRNSKGTGPWTSATPISPGFDTWAKSCADDASENVYAIWEGLGVQTIVPSVAGQHGPIFFSRSTDGGISWSPKTVIHEIDSSFYAGFSADAYSIDAHNGTVVIGFGDQFTDIGFVKSTDGGQTWVKKIIYQFPIPNFDICTMTSDTNNDGIADTLITSVGDVEVLIDNSGNVHEWWSVIRWYSDQSTPCSYNYFPVTDGLYYGNETFPANSRYLIATAQDYNGNGILDLPNIWPCGNQFGNYHIGVTGMPSAGIAPNGRILLSYQSVNESADTSIYHQAHMHMYAMGLEPPYNPFQWTPPINIIPSIAQGGNGEFQEGVFGSMSRLIDNNFGYLVYQRDSAPGHSGSTAGTCDYNNNYGRSNDIIFAKVPLTDLIWLSLDENETNEFNISNNYPNPCTDFTSFEINSKYNSNIVIQITDVPGEIIYSETKNNIKGKNNINLNTSFLKPGLYFIVVSTDNEKRTMQLIRI